MISEAVEEVVMGGSSSRFVKLTSTFFNSICKSEEDKEVAMRGIKVTLDYIGKEVLVCNCWCHKRNENEVGRIKQRQGYKDQWPYNIKIYTDEKGNNKGDAALVHEDPCAAYLLPDFTLILMSGHKIFLEMAKKPAPRAEPSAYGHLFKNLFKCSDFLKVLLTFVLITADGGTQSPQCSCFPLNFPLDVTVDGSKSTAVEAVAMGRSSRFLMMTIATFFNSIRKSAVEEVAMRGSLRLCAERPQISVGMAEKAAPRGSLLHMDMVGSCVLYVLSYILGAVEEVAMGGWIIKFFNDDIGDILQLHPIKQRQGYKDYRPYNINVYTDEKGNNNGDAALVYEDPSAAHSAGKFYNNYEPRGHKISVGMAEKPAPKAQPSAYGQGVGMAEKTTPRAQPSAYGHGHYIGVGKCSANDLFNRMPFIATVRVFSMFLFYILEAVEAVAMGRSSRFLMMTIATFFNSIRKSVVMLVILCLINVVLVNLPWGDNSGNNKGVAALVYEDPSAAHSAGRFYNYYELRGHKISVGMAEKPAPKAQPSAYGQGFLCSLCSCFIFWKLLKKLRWVDHQGNNKGVAGLVYEDPSAAHSAGKSEFDYEPRGHKISIGMVEKPAPKAQPSAYGQGFTLWFMVAYKYYCSLSDYEPRGHEISVGMAEKPAPKAQPSAYGQGFTLWFMVAYKYYCSLSDYELRGHQISVGMAEKPAPKAQPSAYGQGFLCSLCSCFIFWKLLKKLRWVDHQDYELRGHKISVGMAEKTTPRAQTFCIWTWLLKQLPWVDHQGFNDDNCDILQLHP
ncbi:hypothetical protein E3N88_34000 [Mikania micrantha]|uniref:Uncharacterized protein n=1 Tax=Mikania micrantha TaxID=192012 RepID=A0A5N6MCW4_9ASTR|nr:hypothetical protein E3N88_34000 [Mikania micrantha]